MNISHKAYPEKVCHSCGDSAQANKRMIDETRTFNQGVCDVCGHEKTITDVAGYGYPKFNKSHAQSRAKEHVKTKKRGREKRPKNK